MHRFHSPLADRKRPLTAHSPRSARGRVFNSPWRFTLAGLLCLSMFFLAFHPAGAQINETGKITGSPLTILPSPDGSLQVWHSRYSQGASFGVAGSGFFLALPNATTYGPLDRLMEFVEQKPVSGQGTRADPFRSVLRQRIKANEVNLEVTQTITYVNGAQSFQLEWAVANSGSVNACVKAYHAADLYFANDDHGTGYYNAHTGSIGGYNSKKDWFMVFTPLTPDSRYEENFYGTIWDRVRKQQNLQNTINTEYIDNGAALQWDFCLPAGQSKTVSDAWSFGESEGAIVNAAQQAAGGGTSGPLGEGANQYRPADPGSPALTTTIPTPLDITLTPEVVGANLLWAALASILFTVASEVLNRTLAEYEAAARAFFKPLKSLSGLSQKIGLAERLGRPAWYEWTKLGVIVVIYGLTFSYLDQTWNPLSFNGVWLFLTMALAFGVVGLADDIIQWNTARRWKLPARVSIQPGNLLLAVFSTLFSRVLVLTPGVMFGMPEAFEIDPASLDSQRKNRLLSLAAGVLIIILLGSWLPTALTDLALGAAQSLPAGVQPFIMIPVAALQSLLLLIFAVTVQNLFLHMLALPDTIGEMVKRWNRVAWFAALVLASYIYLQTLLNPNGDLARSLQTSNIRVFIGTIAAFLLFTMVMRLLLRRFTPKPAAAPAAEVIFPPAEVSPAGPAQAPTYPQTASQPVVSPTWPAGPTSPGPLQAAPGGQPAGPQLGQAAIPGVPAAFTQQPPTPAPTMQADVQRLLTAWSTAAQEERQAYLRSVAAHGRPAVQLLLGHLSSPDPYIRRAAVSAVGGLGDQSCLPAVRLLLTDRDPGVVQLAQWAIGVLESKPLV